MTDDTAGAVRRTPRPAPEPDVDELVNQTQMLGFGVERGVATLSLKPPHEIVLAWVDAARAMLGDAPNYSETRIDFPTEKAEMEVSAAGEYERFVFTVQRAGKLTPHEARQKAEVELDAVRDALHGLDSDLGDDAPLGARVSELHEAYLGAISAGDEQVTKLEQLGAERDALRKQVVAQEQVLKIVRAQTDDCVAQVDAALGHRYHKPTVHYSIPHVAEKAAAELKQLQARIDAALALIAKGLKWGPFLDPDETRAVLAALQGDQPIEPDERLAGMARPAEGVQLIADAFGIAPAEAAAQLRDAIRAAARSDLDEPCQPTGEADRG